MFVQIDGHIYMHAKERDEKTHQLISEIFFSDTNIAAVEALVSRIFWSGFLKWKLMQYCNSEIHFDTGNDHERSTHIVQRVTMWVDRSVVVTCAE